MSKYQDALNRIIDEYIPMHYEGKPMNQQTEDALLLQELVSKETPMKPIIFGSERFELFECPACNFTLTIGTPKRCEKCNQKLGWREENEI